MRLAALAGLVLACAGLPAAAATQPLTVSHIVLIVLENRTYEEVIGSRDAPYLNALASQYATADNYGLRHPSLPNYLALISGDTFGIDSDCTTCFVNGPSLVDMLEATGKTWKSYQEGLPGPCFLGDAAGNYVLRHNPFLYFRNIREEPVRCQKVVPLAEFSDDLQADNLPDLAWITPDLRHDMHDGSVADGDQWLASFLPPLLAADAWRQDGLLLITWDEGQDNAACCGIASGGHTPLLVVAPRAKPGYHSPGPVTPYGVLRTVEDLWGLDYLGHTGDPEVRPLLDVFD